MLNFIIALFVKKDLLTEEEGKKLSKAVFGRPIPDEYEQAFSFVERLLTEAKLSSTRKYFDPSTFEKKTVETVNNIENETKVTKDGNFILHDVEKKLPKKTVASKK